MRERIFWLVVTFHTTAAAMAMEALCKEQSLPGAPGAYRGLRHGVAGAAGNGEIAAGLGGGAAA